MPTLAAALLAAMVLLSAAWAAGADPPRVVVLQPDDELLRAISLSLSPWGVQTAGSDAPPPQSTQPEAVQTASRIARRLGVDAVVWVSSTEHGSLLWVFDSRTGEIATRMLAETPPFDGAAAAAVALSVKTVLRASVVAPPGERFGVEPATPPKERISALEIGAGGHWAGGSQVELRVELAGVVWLAAARRLGLSAELSSGPGLTVTDTSFSGRYREIVAGGKAHFRFLRGAWSSAQVSLGGAAHWSTLDGTLVAGSLGRHVTRLTGSLDVETSVNIDVGSGTYVGASLGAAYFPTYQRYLVEGRPVFSPWPLTTTLAGYWGVELF